MKNTHWFDHVKVPRYEQIRWQLQQFLVEKQWDVNIPIPSEQVLAKQYNASIGTVRKAVECLVDEGILEKSQGRGTFLKTPNFDVSMMRFFRLRDSQGKYTLPIGDIKKIELIGADTRINPLLSLAPNDSLIYMERLRSVGQVTILSEKIWVPESLFKGLTTVPLSEIGDFLYPFYYRQYGQFVMSAQEQLSVVVDYQDKYISAPEGTPFVKICRLATGIDGHAIEYRESYGLAQHFRYEVEIR